MQCGRFGFMLRNKAQLLSGKGLRLKAINNIVSLSWNDHHIKTNNGSNVCGIL